MNASEKLISAAQVFEARSRGEPIAIADVRTRAEFEALHAVGASHHPLDELDPKRTVESFGVPGLGLDIPLYITCQTGHRASVAAERLAQAGYRNVKLIEGGIEAWEADKLPVVRGRRPQVLPLQQQVQVAVGMLLLLKTLLGVAIHPVFFVLTAGLGVGLIYAGLTHNCLLAQLLNKMPWNRVRAAQQSA